MVATPTEVENFIETYQTKHISRAAIRLGITQPTLTQSLQKLEEKLGAKLFYRTKQGIVPTKEGNFFYIKARTLLDSWRDVGNKIHTSRNAIQGKFRVGCHPSVGTFTLPPFFEKLSREAPGIEVDLFHDHSRKVTEQVISYQLDLGFVVNPVRHPDLVLKKIGEDTVAFWKKKGAAEPPRRLFVDPSLKQVETLLGKARHREFKDWNLVQTSNLEVIRELVVRGQGVGILPGRVAGLDQENLTIYKKSLPTFFDEIFLAYKKEVVSSIAGRELIRLASGVLD